MTDDAIQPIVSALRLDDPVTAQRLCELQLQRQPDESDVLLLLALSLQRQGKFDAATEIYAQLTRLDPDSALHWGNFATALKVAGDFEAAERAAQKAVQLAPDDADQLEQLGLLQFQHNALLAARDTLLRAFRQSPQSPSIRIHAARACVECSDSRADELLHRWREWLPLEESLQYELADTLLQTGDAEAALELLEDLVQRAPGHVPVRLLLANVCERVNRLQDVDALLREIIADGAVDDPVVHRDVSHQQAQLAMRRGDSIVARTLLEQSGPLNDGDYAHYFTLAKTCDQAGDFAAAMRALQTAHEVQVAKFRMVTPARFEADASILPRADARITEADYRSWLTLRAPNAAQSPVFIVGFPRSGTTLLEQMLDAHPRLQSMDERPFFNMLADQLDDIGLQVPWDLHKLQQRDCDELRKGYLTLASAKVPRRWDAQLVDKNPLNMLWLPMIHRLFPQAKFIFALRHPCDVILSCYMQNFRSAALVAASASLDRLAQAYVAAMECWLYHVEVFKPQVLVSRHEELVADTPRQTRRIAEFLGLDGADSMLDFALRAREKGYIATPSYTQVIEPINAKGLDRWHHYRVHFEPLLETLRPMLDRWNYVVPGLADRLPG
jgi:tetratricopeptide (TPR) repeat protein